MIDEQDAGSELFLVVEAGESAQGRLTAALTAAPIASVLIVPPAGQELDASKVKPLVEQAQSHGAATLVLDDAALGRQIGADGVHLTHGKDIESRYRAARQTAGRGGIVGIDAGASRHDAMSLAEAGADYVAFGISTGFEQPGAARERRLDLIAWWAEIFEVPCVALDVGTPEDAAELARAGADFIGVKIETGSQLQEIGRRISTIASALRSAMAD